MQVYISFFHVIFILSTNIINLQMNDIQNLIKQECELNIHNYDNNIAHFILCCIMNWVKYLEHSKKNIQTRHSK